MANKLLKADIVDIPVIPLRNLIIFPGKVLEFTTGRQKSIASLKNAAANDNLIFLVSQVDASVSNPKIEDLYSTGVLCEILRTTHIEAANEYIVKAKGLRRGTLLSISKTQPFLCANVQLDDNEPAGINQDGEEICCDVLKALFSEYVHFFPKLKTAAQPMMNISSLSRLCDSIAFTAYFSLDDKQKLLDEFDISVRANDLLAILKNDIGMLKIEADIHSKVQREIDKNQREYYLREELKVISEALGEGENPLEEADEYTAAIRKLQCGEEVREKLLKEAEKLKKTPYGSHEGTVIRTYLDKCLEIPFGKYSKNAINLEKSRRVLDRDHYSLDSVKDRIIEALAVYKRSPEYYGQVICLFGPPGVGKTSIVKSLAKSMNRKYVRIALGGISDEAEIRGHRRTYIGAMAGRIVEAIIKAGVMNPIILLDEIDKVGRDYKGDPAAALMEALDTEQNSAFYDHYIDFPLNLSKVMFITTANDVGDIAPPLRDRMEIIELNSYTYIEKFHIAKEYLLKKEMKKHSLRAREFKISDNVFQALIENYTCEAGVRSLEKQIAALCRKGVFQLEDGQKTIKIEKGDLPQLLGPEKFQKDKINLQDEVGVVNGLAWTSAGGTLLPIEVSAVDGTGKIVLTGNLGDVMKESAKTAVSFVRSSAGIFGIDSEFYKNKDIHIHAMEGAVPKDGPSAGLAITTALVSELTGAPIKKDIAMTGEISLKGKALPIGGLKEKSMAAYTSGCKLVVIPKDNVKDLAEVCDEVKDNMKFVSVSHFSELIEYAFVNAPDKSSFAFKNVLSRREKEVSVITQ